MTDLKFTPTPDGWISTDGRFSIERFKNPPLGTGFRLFDRRDKWADNYSTRKQAVEAAKGRT